MAGGQGSVAAVLMALACAATVACDVPVDLPPPLVFEGLGLDDFKGSGSIAAALRGATADGQQPEVPLGLPVDVVVKGPMGRERTLDPWVAEVKGKLDGVDVIAGIQADPTVVEDGPKKWVGGVRMSSSHGSGREVLELRTSLGRQNQVGTLGVEVGPRIERRLRGGLTVFLDGKAQAQARRQADTGDWMLPGRAGDGSGTLGLTASTGWAR